MAYKNKEDKLAYAKKYRAENKEKVNEASRNFMRKKRLDPEYKKMELKNAADYRFENKDKLKQNRFNNRFENRDKALFKRYGITRDQFNIMLFEQNNKCGICGEEFKPIEGKPYTQPNVDHCHSTGKVRGLLCSPCNRSLGFNDKFKKQIKEYLK